LGNYAEPIGVVLEGLIIAAVGLIPQQLGVRGGHLSLGVIQTPPVFLGLLAARHIQGQHKVWVFDKLVSAGKLLLFAMFLSFVEYYYWDSAPSVLPIFGGFPLLHITIHIVEQIGIYTYALAVAVLDAGECGRVLTFAADPVLGVFPVITEDANMYAPRISLSDTGCRGTKRKCSENFDADPRATKLRNIGLLCDLEQKSRLTEVQSVPIPCVPTVDAAVLLDPEVRVHHPEFNTKLHELYPQAGIIRVLGERSCFLVKSRQLIVQILRDEKNFSSHPWPDGRIVALNTMKPAQHAVVKGLLSKFYSPHVVRGFQGDFRCGVIDALAPDKNLQRSGFCAVTWVARMHMAGALRMLGGEELESMASNVEVLDKFNKMNDDMVRLVAPLGGIGAHSPSLLKDGLRPFAGLFRGLVKATAPLFGLMARVGLRQTYAIVRPELNLYQGSSYPRTGTWQCPELLQSVPRYFIMLDEILTGAPGRGKCRSGTGDRGFPRP
jgi:hypothetical protein